MSKVLVFEDMEWAKKSAELLIREIRGILHLNGRCNILLTGGRGGQLVYDELADSLRQLNGQLYFYFGDERCVPIDDPESNYRMALIHLFSNSIPDNCIVHRIYGEAFEPLKEADRYADILPSVIDIMLFSMGEDGHIASLFPNDKEALEAEKKVIFVKAPKRPYNRLTISGGEILKAGNIYCFVKGSIKGSTLKSVFQKKNDIFAMPARLIIRGTWLLDKSAEQQFL